MSKISRSLVVAIFMVLIAFLLISDFVYINKTDGIVQGTSSLIKIGYFFLMVVLMLIYSYVREKISRLKLSKPIPTIYRYMYIILVMIASTFFKIYSTMGQYPTRTLILYFVLVYLIGMCMQRIIFNISKSEVLSTLGMFISFTLPNVVQDKTMDLNSKFIALALLLAIYVLQILLDELKQLNLKNRKYLIQALILSVCIGLSTICGVNYLLWIAVAIVSLFITSNLDSTSLNLSNRQNKTIKKKKNNYFIYKIERIKISKLLISLCITLCVSTAIYYGGRTVVRVASQNNAVCANIVNDLTVGVHSQIDKSFTNIKTQAYNFVGLSTKFYIFCFIYIILMEVLSFVLHRKYDTKSTVLKLCFVLLFLIVTVFKLNMLYYQLVLTLLLVLICIVNTTNIYYNREERIKMIQA